MTVFSDSFEMVYDSHRLVCVTSLMVMMSLYLVRLRVFVYDCLRVMWCVSISSMIHILRL